MDKSNEDVKTEVFTETIPEYKVSGNDYEPAELNGISDILFMKNLSGETFHSKGEAAVTKEEMLFKLREFAIKYSEWIITQKNNISNLSHQILKDQAGKNLDICERFFKRMLAGIEVLSKNNKVCKAFCDANKAMFMQRAMASLIKRRKEKFGDDLYPSKIVNEPLPDWKEEYGRSDFKWRPFQLAFLLSQIEGTIYPNSEDRNTVDLIWFSTGGGKTEAYLGLTAFTIFYRGLREFNPDDGAGVAVMMRYTLRLLNMQQFQRASSLICACELIRRGDSKSYGEDKPISLGIWVGQITPNKWVGSQSYPQFRESYNQLFANPSFDTKFHFPIYSCPCCGTKIIKTGSANAQQGEWGIIKYNNNFYGLKCTNNNCDFHIPENTSNFSKKLPIHFVDEDIYEEQPSLLFSTVDKYASINWNENSFKLFNYDLQSKEYTHPAPELIIQDELHLINSTLGTIYGVYEIAIDELCSGKNIMPKIIAATATVRNAEDQCRQLYARKHFMQFPPPGIDADDSFYSRKMNLDENARLYIGLQPAGHTNTTAQVRLVSMIMQRIPMLDTCNDVMDNFYTSLIYFNTLKELGKFRTLLVDDIDKYRDFLATKIYSGVFDAYDESKIAELSSFRTGKEINAYLEQIEKRKLKSINCDDAIPLFKLGIRLLSNINYQNSDFHKIYFPLMFNNQELFSQLNIKFIENDIEENKKLFIYKIKTIFGNNEPDVLKVIASTSMVSVGVDIARLNVMQITGQPKSHSEYIQASSRVGRNWPGLIITSFNPAKNRDRSHYEKFIDYHQAFYKDVESTTVTPFSKPALEKALPAVILSLMQAFHYGNSNPVFNEDDKNNFDKWIEKIRIRAKNSTLNIIAGELAVNNINKISADIKTNWKTQYAALGEKIRFSKYSDYVYQGRLNNPNVLNIQNSLYINPAYSNLWPNKLKCMSTLRNVEFHSLIDIKK